MRESSVQKKIIRELTRIGAYVVKVNQATRNGVPDLIVCLRGQFIAIEVKTDTGKASALQAIQIERITEAGGKTFVCHGFADFRERVLPKLAEKKTCPSG